MKKIDMALEINSITKQYKSMKSKEEIVEDLCPSNFGMKDSGGCFDDNGCVKCWDRETIGETEDMIIKPDFLQSTSVPTLYTPYLPTNEDRFNILRQSPINGICLNNIDVEQLKRYLKIKNEDGIIYFKQFNVNKDEEVSLQYDDIPKLIKWLQDVYDFTTKLKAEIDKEEKYTNFYLAREHMHNGGKCEYEGKIYYIVNGVMYLEFSGKEDKIENRVAYLSLEDIDSLEWLMLDK